jgi:cytoskeleton protein RodZ
VTDRVACPVLSGARGRHSEGVCRLSNIGEELRSAREAQGRTIQEASAATRIRPSYLEALEAERFDELGGNVYAKGFIRSYASYLGLDPTPLLDAYRSQERPEAPVFERLPRALTGGLGVERRRRGRSSWLLVGIVCVSIVLVASLWSLLKPPRSTQTPLSATPPATAPPTTLGEPTTTTQPKPKDITLVLHYVGASWTKVAADGKVSFQGIGVAADRRTFKAKHTIDVTLGAPGQVQVQVNGQSIVPQNTGQIWHRSFTVGQSVTNSAEGATGGSSGGSSSVTSPTPSNVG